LPHAPATPNPPAAPAPGDGRLKPSWFVAGCLAAALAGDGWATESPAALRTCPRFGDGFFAVPGTDTCLRIEGEAGLDLFAHGSHVKDERFDGDPFVIAGRPTRKARVSFEPTAGVSFDTRTATAFGTLRTSLELGTDSEDDRTFGAGGRSRNLGVRGRDEDRSTLELDTTRVQLGGFTAGLTDSFFGIDNPVNTLGTHIADFGEEQILFGYTADLSKDLSVSVAIESGEEADEGEGLFDYVFLGAPSAETHRFAFSALTRRLKVIGVPLGEAVAA